LGDMATYLALLFFAMLALPQWFLVLLALYLYRLMGVVAYLLTEHKRYFILFPNFFIETILLLAIYQHLGWQYKDHAGLYNVSFVLLFIYKIVQEFIFHSQRDQDVWSLLKKTFQ
jgi:hypothetical protein